MVRSQIVNSTPDPSFGHNLCCICSNGSCEPILNIYVSISFQKYKELLNPLNFDSHNCSLNIRESTGTPTPKGTPTLGIGVPLGVWGFIPSHSLSLPGACNMTPGLPSWPTTLQPLALVMNPRLGLQQCVFLVYLFIKYFLCFYVYLWFYHFGFFSIFLIFCVYFVSPSPLLLILSFSIINPKLNK
jgi:hypothetical protein